MLGWRNQEAESRGALGALGAGEMGCSRCRGDKGDKLILLPSALSIAAFP
jgi:hypothetical protein